MTPRPGQDRNPKLRLRASPRPRLRARPRQGGPSEGLLSPEAASLAGTGLGVRKPDPLFYRLVLAAAEALPTLAHKLPTPGSRGCRQWKCQISKGRLTRYGAICDVDGVRATSDQIRRLLARGVPALPPSRARSHPFRYARLACIDRESCGTSHWPHRQALSPYYDASVGRRLWPVFPGCPATRIGWGSVGPTRRLRRWG